MSSDHIQPHLPIASHPLRRTVLDDLGSAARNVFCRLADLDNEASVEEFFLSRLIADLGYKDNQIATKRSLDELAVGRGRRREQYKPDYALLVRRTPRCVIDAKGVGEDLDEWIEQCSGYCLALNRKYGEQNPVKYFILSNGLKTVLYERDRDEPLLELNFADFTPGNPKFAHLKKLSGRVLYQHPCRLHWQQNPATSDLSGLRLPAHGSCSPLAIKLFGSRRGMDRALHSWHLPS